MAKVLAPPRLDITAEYKGGFEGMVDKPVTLAVRRKLFSSCQRNSGLIRKHYLVKLTEASKVEFSSLISEVRFRSLV
jgi:hypothetical protein